MGYCGERSRCNGWSRSRTCRAHAPYRLAGGRPAPVGPVHPGSVGSGERPVRDSNPLLHRDKVIRCPYANGADVFTAHCTLHTFHQGWSRESNPGRDVHSVACCHYTMTTVCRTSRGADGGPSARPLRGAFAFLPLRKQEPRSRSCAGLRGWCSCENARVPVTRCAGADRCCYPAARPGRRD